MTTLLLLAGLVVLATVAYDAISTTMSPGTGAGPLTSRLAGGWWRFARRVASRPDARIIISAGPVVLLLTIFVWLLLLWAGWTLVFTADPDAVISAATLQPASGWSRVYFAGFTAFTLGVGDYIPNGQPWEILTAIAVISGLGLTTLAITYLMPVVSAVTARRVQANIIAGLGSTPQQIVLAGLRDHRFPYFEHRLQALADSIMETAEKHLAYPVLHYFHSAERHVDLRTQVLLLDDAVTLLQHGVAADMRPHPAVLEGLRHAITQLVERATEGSPHIPPPEVPKLDVLRQAGIPTVNDDASERDVVGLTDHRRRIAHFANESLWPIARS